MLQRDLLFLPARELGRQLRAGHFTSLELTQSYLERLQTVGARLNAVVTLCEERALREADPAASIDFDAGGDQMRVSTFLSVFEVVEIVDRAGISRAKERVVAQRSECCGGCGG